MDRGIKMGNILILYASTTGNTETMADVMAETLEEIGYQVEIKTFDFDWIDVEEILDYDAFLVGTHTWDDGSLPYEVEDFYDDLADIDLAHKPCAVFGSADSFYPTYGGAIDLIGDRLTELGADVFPERLKVDMYPDKQDIQACQTLAKQVDKMVQKNIEHNHYSTK